MNKFFAITEEARKYHTERSLFLFLSLSLKYLVFFFSFQMIRIILTDGDNVDERAGL